MGTLLKNDENHNDKSKILLSNKISIEKSDSYPKNKIIKLYRRGAFAKLVDLSDRTVKRLFVVQLVEFGVKKSQIANALAISRQTIYNYLTIQQHFGREGLILGYSAAKRNRLREERKKHSTKRDKSDGRRHSNILGSVKSAKARRPRKVYI